MSGQPDFQTQKPYALDRLVQLQGQILQLSQGMVIQRARIEKFRQTDLAVARDTYNELQRTRTTLVDALAESQLFLMEMEEYKQAVAAGQLKKGLAGFNLMSTAYKPVYEALSQFSAAFPVGQKTNAAVVGRLMNNIKLGYYPTDPGNISLILQGIKFPEGVTTNLIDPCCGCGKALRQLAQGNNCYAYGVELDESRAEEALTRLHRVGFGSFFHCRISHEAFHLLFLNPPYLSVINEGGGRSRHEKRFLIESLPTLMYGGLLVYVIPYYIVLNMRTDTGARKTKWIATGIPEGGKKNLKQAEELLAKTRYTYEDMVIHTEPKSKTTVASDILFADYMIKWLGIIKNSVEVDTYAGYVNNVKKRIAPYFRELGVTLRNVTALDIENFYSYCFNELNLKGTTVQRFHANIHKAMKYAVKHDLIIANPMNKVERPKGQKYTGSFYSISELEELFDAIKGDPCEFPVLMAAFYGLRRSEIMGLRWQAIDFENNQITIDHTVVQCVCDGVAMTVEKDRTKNKSSCRSMPLVPQYRELLLSMKERQENCRKLCGNCYTESDYIFVNDLGVPYKPNYVTQHFKLVLQKHELRDIRFHDLRHTCASLLLKNGVPMKDIQEWLGHSDYNTTANIYAHLDTTSKSTSATRMTSVVSINPSICVNV